MLLTVDINDAVGDNAFALSLCRTVYKCDVLTARRGASCVYQACGAEWPMEGKPRSKEVGAK